MDNKRIVELLSDMILECENRYMWDWLSKIENDRSYDGDYSVIRSNFLNLGWLTEQEYWEVMDKRSADTPIFFISLNVDGRVNVWSYNTVEEIKTEWISDDCCLPANDDPIIYAKVHGKEVKASDFYALLNTMGIYFN